MKHYKKLTQPYFNEVYGRIKTFELRKNDCYYNVGDVIILQEYDNETDTYSGSEIAAEITYILKDYIGLQEGYCILGIIVLSRKRGKR